MHFEQFVSTRMVLYIVWIVQSFIEIKEEAKNWLNNDKQVIVDSLSELTGSQLNEIVSVVSKMISIKNETKVTGKKLKI